MTTVPCPACESGWRRADELPDYSTERAPQHLVCCPVCRGRGAIGTTESHVYNTDNRRPGYAAR